MTVRLIQLGSEYGVVIAQHYLDALSIDEDTPLNVEVVEGRGIRVTPLTNEEIPGIEMDAAM